MPDKVTCGDVDSALSDLPRLLRWFIEHAPHWLVPSLESEPQDPHYRRSFVTMRLGSGGLAFLLPIALVVIVHWLDDDQPWIRGSLSEYYYSGAREVFVGGLSAIVVFLIAYRVLEWSLDNVLSWIAAVFLLVVVVFPTGRPSEEMECGHPSEQIDCTPLQNALSESLVETLHYIGAIVFIGSLAMISFFFCVREARRTQRGWLPPAFWWKWHLLWVALIVAAIVWILVTRTGWGPKQSLFIGEVVAVWAFALSWIAKGLDYRRPTA